MVLLDKKSFPTSTLLCRSVNFGPNVIFILLLITICQEPHSKVPHRPLTCVNCSSNGPKSLQVKDVQKAKISFNEMSVKGTSPILLCYISCGNSVHSLYFYMNCSHLSLEELYLYHSDILVMNYVFPF